ncbi:MAG: YafY family transcriptional regulator [Chloroflexi bacterium]|nr:YafY family transcriptional regulator [Chloroflexota bacterium]
MRADRLLSILLLLQVRQRVTAGELAQRLEVSERTIYRDMDALSSAGIPVFAERGHGGGWGLVDRYRTDLTGLNKLEIEALFLQPSGLLADLGLDKASTTALIKLLAALPSTRRRDAEHVRQRIHVDGAGWFQAKESVPFLSTLQEAVWQERKLQFSYQRSDAKVVERLVDPLGLVVKGSVWYLIAAIEDGMRTYRVSRMQEAQVTEQPCVRPKGFDLAAHWEASVVQFKADLPRYPATLRMTSDVVPHIHRLRYTQVEDVSESDADGRVTVSVLFEMEDKACEYVLGFGSQIEVIDPPALRQRVIDIAESIVALYTRLSRLSETSKV